MPVKDGFFFKCSMGNFCNMLTRTKGSNFFVTSGRDESIILYTKIKLDRMEMAGIFFFYNSWPLIGHHHMLMAPDSSSDSPSNSPSKTSVAESVLLFRERYRSKASSPRNILAPDPDFSTEPIASSSTTTASIRSSPVLTSGICDR